LKIRLRVRPQTAKHRVSDYGRVKGKMKYESLAKWASANGVTFASEPMVNEYGSVYGTHWTVIGPEELSAEVMNAFDLLIMGNPDWERERQGNVWDQIEVTFRAY
jgi:hypothetical protein